MTVTTYQDYANFWIVVEALFLIGVALGSGFTLLWCIWTALKAFHAYLLMRSRRIEREKLIAHRITPDFRKNTQEEDRFHAN